MPYELCRITIDQIMLANRCSARAPVTDSPKTRAYVASRNSALNEAMNRPGFSSIGWIRIVGRLPLIIPDTSFFLGVRKHPEAGNQVAERTGSYQVRGNRIRRLVGGNKDRLEIVQRNGERQGRALSPPAGERIGKSTKIDARRTCTLYGGVRPLPGSSPRAPQ